MGVRAKKSYKRGGKVVAQGADRDDLRAERKMERQEKRKKKKQDRREARTQRQMERQGYTRVGTSSLYRR